MTVDVDAVRPGRIEARLKQAARDRHLPLRPAPAGPGADDLPRASTPLQQRPHALHRWRRRAAMRSPHAEDEGDVLPHGSGGRHALTMVSPAMPRRGEGVAGIDDQRRPFGQAGIVDRVVIGRDQHARRSRATVSCVERHDRRAGHFSAMYSRVARHLRHDADRGSRPSAAALLDQLDQLQGRAFADVVGTFFL